LRHLFASDRIVDLVDAEHGLTAAEVEDRRRRYGSNNILGDPQIGWRAIARDTARDPMIWFLVATALLFAWLGDYAEAGVLSLALLPIAGMDAYLHRRTQATTEGLAGRLAAYARVLRDGATNEISSVELVPGDLVIVTEGGAIPADGVFVAGANLQADESSLTGEALPVRKHVFRGNLGRDETALENECWGAAGTRLLTGEARLRLLALSWPDSSSLPC
jgi:Ca2+-transporting ATPase